MIPGSARNWIAVNAVQQFSLNKKWKPKESQLYALENQPAGRLCGAVSF
jgi:hypothetical protein